MRINRKFLYGGVFLLALGAVLVAADLRVLDLAAVQDAMRLWPIVVIVIGVAIVVRRSPAALPAGLLAAAVPGLVLGGAIAVGPRFVVDCAPAGSSSPAAVTEGPLPSPRDVSLRAHCGSLVVTTSTGQTGWELSVNENAGPAPLVVAADGSFIFDATGILGGGPWGDWSLDDGLPSRWQLVLPSGDLGSLAATVQATQTSIDLANARVASLDLTTTASDVELDLSGALVGDVNIVSSFGQVTLYVPSGSDLTGNLKVTGGRLVICTNRMNPLDPIGLRVSGRGFAAGVRARGTQESRRSYESQGYARASHHADLDVNASFGSIDIDPFVGGCK
jgi:hypothetical protein